MLLPVVTAVAFTVLFLIALVAMRNSDQTISRIQDEFFHALELSHDLETQALSLRHMMTESFTSGNLELLSDADDLAADFRQTLAGCRMIPEFQGGRLDSLQAAFDGYYDLARDVIQELTDPAQELDLDFDVGLYERVALMNGRYLALEDMLAEIVTWTEQELTASLQSTRERVVKVRRRMNVVSIVFLGIMIVMSTGAVASIVRPLRGMSAVAKSIAGGDLSRKLDYRSSDELGELADSFRDMQTALIEDIRQREAAEADLIAAQGQIIQSEKMAALGKLVAGLAHELNTPVGVVTSAADVMNRSRDILERTHGADDTDQRAERALRAMNGSADNLAAAAGRIRELVDGLKAFSQLDQAEFQQTDLNAGLRATLTVVGHDIPSSIDVSLDLGKIPHVLGYPAQLNQLFLQLIRRAVRDIDPPGRVTITTQADDTAVTVAISDTGHGYDRATLHRLFEPGFRDAIDRTRMDWGLVTAARIAQRHGGELTAQSEPGTGSTFTLRIPRRHIQEPSGSGSA